MTKKGAIDGLIQAIRHVLAGKIYASEAVSQQAARRPPARHSNTGRTHWGSHRSRDPGLRIDRAWTQTAGIADQLGVSVKTIETYRSNIKTKLNLRDAAALVRYAATWIERL